MNTSVEPTAKFRADYQKPEFLISKTVLEFDLDDTKTKVSAKLEIECQNQNADLCFDSEVSRVLEIKINEVLLNANQFDESNGKLTIKKAVLEGILKEPTSAFTVSTICEINPESNLTLEGLYKAGNAFCTQCEAEGFRKITPYFDRPDVLAEFFVTIKGNASKYPHLLSNGNLLKSEIDPESGIKTVQWHDPFPKPSYLFALVAGDFDLLSSEYRTKAGREIELEIFVDKGNVHLAHHAMSSLKKSMKWDEEVFGLEYDLDTYMIVAVDFFNMGAMENKGLNVFNSKYVLADENTATDADFHGVEAVIAHEYFHNWTGNRVTCRDWFQLSLKEGLTVYRDQRFSADMGSAVIERIGHAKVMRTAQFAEDAGPMSHPIRPEKVVEMNNFYTVTIYDKGAEVIRMLNTLLGEDGFRKGMDLYFARHDGQAVTCDDFVAAMADANEYDLEQFSRWYSQAGTPVVSVEERQSGSTYQVTLTQSVNNKQSDELALLIPVRFELISKQTGKSLQRGIIHLKKSEQSFEFNVSEPADLILFEDFSAPVKVHRKLSISQMQRMIKHASDEFSRWDILQQMWAMCVTSRFSNDLQQAIVDVYGNILIDESLTPALKAELITIPSFQSLAEICQPVDVDSILHLLTSVGEKVANKNTPSILSQLTELSNIKSGFEIENVAKRSLKSALLNLFARSTESHKEELVTKVFHQSKNMSEKSAALQAATLFSEALVEDFASHLIVEFPNQSLVLDKALQSVATVNTNNIYLNMQAWSEKSGFDRTNPNRMRALYGSFVMRNPSQFHSIDGKGYKFLKDLILEIDKFNPQLAARLVDPLLAYGRYAAPRSELMKSELQAMALQKLSKDVREKVDAAL